MYITKMNKDEIYALLDAKSMAYEVTEHKAVFNMAELAEVALPYPEADAKNLFVRDDKHEHYYLITVQGEKRVDLKAFRRAHGTRNLSFASAQELWDMLGLNPGSVGPFGLMNDGGCRVGFYLDSDLAGGLIGCHPNDNTATVWLQSRDLVQLIREHGNAVEIISC